MHIHWERKQTSVTWGRAGGKGQVGRIAKGCETILWGWMDMVTILIVMMISGFET